MAILYITSHFPFGKSEVWAINEFNSICTHKKELIIFPKTGKGEIINEDAIKFKPNVIDLPFMNFSIFFCFSKWCIFRMPTIFRLMYEISNQSNSISDFFKGIVLLPKTIKLTEILAKKQVEHIHSFSLTSSAIVASLLSYITKIPWSYTLHTSEIVNVNYKKSIFYYSSRALFCRTISERTKQDLIEFIGPKLSQKVFKIHLGVDISKVIKFERRLNEIIQIATPAELASRKGHVYALEACRDLIRKGFVNFKWFFYGSGPLKLELEKKINEYNLTQHCFLIGNIDHKHLLGYYNQDKIDIVVLSSVSTEVPEGIPVSLMEAMSYAIPVIATNCGGTNELVDGETGILIDEHDYIAISNSIIRLITDEDLRKTISKNGVEKVSRDFNTIKNTYELINLFKNEKK